MGNNYIPGKHQPSSAPAGLVVLPNLYCIPNESRRSSSMDSIACRMNEYNIIFILRQFKAYTGDVWTYCVNDCSDDDVYRPFWSKKQHSTVYHNHTSRCDFELTQSSKEVNYASKKCNF